ncbi:ATP-grasp domain-containing protein [Heliobacillus mobilis]|uniref:ATP-grasp domain-containing protein n=1 Tax=Heliobacterium mobile TaxID=28064 RepID=A0A6I3SL32_HELMO|nr:ATP-grasp domain-containing protein [Heliobacterium mobile]
MAEIAAITVAFLAVGRRVALLRAFREELDRFGGKLLGADVNRLVPAAAVCHDFRQIGRWDADGYGDDLIHWCQQQRVDLLISLWEPEFFRLSTLRPDLTKVGTKLLLSEKPVLDVCMDKLAFSRWCGKEGFATPNLWDATDWHRWNGEVPLFIKPRRGMGSKSACPVKEPVDLEPYANHPDAWILQEFIDGKEYTFDAFLDAQGRVIEVVMRERVEVRAGEVIKSRTVFFPEPWQETCRLCSLLGKMGAIGPLTVQGFIRQSDGAFFFTEVNPRFGGGVPLAIQAGALHPRWLIQMVEDRMIEHVPGSYQKNLWMLRYDDAVFVVE